MTRLGDCVEYCPPEFADLEVVFEAGWSDYEDSGYIVVFKFFDELMAYADASGPGCLSHKDSDLVFDPYPITEQELVQIREEWKDDEF